MWPSWSSALGNALGTALPIDTLNRLAACPVEFDPETCFNAALGQFVCSEGSHVYGYRSSGGEEYSLYAQLESDAVHEKRCVPRHVQLVFAAVALEECREHVKHAVKNTFHRRVARVRDVDQLQRLRS